MASIYSITQDSVRNKIGISSSDVSDTITLQFIEEAEQEAEQILRRTFRPTKASEQFTNDDASNVVILNNRPVIRVTKAYAGTSGHITPAYLNMDSLSGMITIQSGAEKSVWDDTKDMNNFMEYYHGELEDTTTETSLTSGISASPGTAVNLVVGTTVGFAADDNIKIESIGGGTTNIEITTLTGTYPLGPYLTAPISWNHRAGSRIIKMQAPDMAKELMRVLAAIRCALYMIGNTYTFATSYSFPEHSVTKGVPYPHFDRALTGLVKQRDYLLTKLRGLSGIGMA